MKQPRANAISLDRLRFNASDNLAEALRRCWPKIIERFVSLFEDLSPPGDGVASTHLASHLPATLQEIRSALAGKLGPSADSPPHEGDLAQLLAKFALLDRVVLEEVAYHFGSALAAEEVTHLTRALHAVASRAILNFVGYQTRDFAQAVEAQNQFLSILNHDLRGDLNAILLTLQILQRELASVPRAKDSITELDRVANLIHQTLQKLDASRSRQKPPRRQMEPKSVAR